MPLDEFDVESLESEGGRKAGAGPLILTVDGKAEWVVQDAASYEKMLDVVEQALLVEHINRGLEDIREGRTEPLDEALAEIVRALDLPPGP